MIGQARRRIVVLATSTVVIAAAGVGVIAFGGLRSGCTLDPDDAYRVTVVDDTRQPISVVHCGNDDCSAVLPGRPQQVAADRSLTGVRVGACTGLPLGLGGLDGAAVTRCLPVAVRNPPAVRSYLVTRAVACGPRRS